MALLESLFVCLHLYNHIHDFFTYKENWENLFSTIVTKARTIEVLENGSNRSGVLLLVFS